MNNAQELLSLSAKPVANVVKRWWKRQKAKHYLKCEAIEAAKAKAARQEEQDAMANAAYYARKAIFLSNEIKRLQ